MYRSTTSAVLALIVVACGPAAVEAPPPAAEIEKVATGEAPAPMQRGSDAWCARNLCGCWEDATLRYSAELRDAAGAPAAGVEAVCHGEETPIVRSGADGVLAFEIATQQSPGCGYQRCSNMLLRDPQGRFAEKPVTAWIDGVITLEPATSP